MSARNGNVLVSDSFHDVTRDHPAMQWMEKFTQFLNTGERTDAARWYSPKFVYVSGDGIEVPGGEPAWSKMYDEYDHYFTDYHHEPYSIVCFEADSHEAEYEMVGQAQLYANLVGDPDDVPKVTNPKDGKQWDVVRPGAWHFWYEKTDDPQHGGYQMRRMHIMMDSAPVEARLINRGHKAHTDLVDKHVENHKARESIQTFEPH